MVYQSKNKGTRKCNCCRERFVPFNNNSNQKYCTKHDACITETKIWALAQQEKKNASAKRSAEKQWKKTKKEGYIKLMNHGDWENKLQPEINHIARLLDRGYNCMMCDIPLPPSKRENGCHYHSVGSNNSLRFNLLNIFRGCHQCNGENGGNIIGYDNRLIADFGREFWEYVKFDLVRLHPLVKMHPTEFDAIIKEAQLIVKELTLANKIYSTQGRIEMRHALNKRLGIYPF